MNLVEFIRGKTNDIYRCMLAFLLFGSGLFLGGNMLGVQNVEVKHFGIGVVWIALFTAFFLQKGIGRMGIAAVTAVMIILRLLMLGGNLLSDIFASYPNWIKGDLVEPRLVNFCEHVQLFLLVIVSFGVAYLLEKRRVLRMLSAIAAMVLYVDLYISESHVHKLGTAFLLTFVLINLTEFAELKWKKERKEHANHAYELWLWPVWMLFIICMLFAPASKEPFQWSLARMAYDKVRDECIILSQRLTDHGAEGFVMTMSGFSEDATLGGKIKKSQKEVLSLKTNKQMATNLYLGGTMKDTFDGREWISLEEPTLTDCRLDTLETLYGLADLQDEQLKEALSATELEVDYRFIHTKYLFTPLKMATLRQGGTNLLKDDGDLATQKRGYRDSYHAFFYQMNLESEALHSLLEEAQKDDVSRWNKICKTYHAEDESFQSLMAYRNSIQEQYNQKPELSSEMQAWLEETTKDCVTDIEKLQAIEQALQTFTYTKNPGELPESINSPEAFLDYFVLDKKTGYCSYFATAFILLARAEGMPARYVQGFCVPMQGASEMLVTEDMAHAWPEVYFTGGGWIPFDPTAGYGEVRYVPWYVAKNQSGGQGQMHVSTEKESQENVDKNNDTAGKEKNTSVLLIGMLSLLAILLLCVTLDVLIGRWTYKRKTIEEKYRCQVERNLYILEKLGWKRQPWETLAEYQQKLLTECELFQRGAPEFIEEYEKILYGDEPVTEQHVSDARNERQCLLAYLGKWGQLKEKYNLKKS